MTIAETKQKSQDFWAMKVGSGSGDGYEYVLVSPGNYPGTIVGLFDIGHQHIKTKDGREQDVRKLVLVFELVEKRPDGKPHILAERYTWSMRDNSNFYSLVINVTGRKFAEGEVFNPLSLVGTPVMVSVTNIQSGERTYHNVGGVARYPKSFPAPPDPVTKPVAWSVLSGEPLPPSVDTLPYVYGKPIAQLAKESAEWKDHDVAAVIADGSDSIPF